MLFCIVNMLLSFPSHNHKDVMSCLFSRIPLTQASQSLIRLRPYKEEVLALNWTEDLMLP